MILILPWITANLRYKAHVFITQSLISHEVSKYKSLIHNIWYKTFDIKKLLAWWLLSGFDEYLDIGIYIYLNIFRYENLFVSYSYNLLIQIHLDRRWLLLLLFFWYIYIQIFICIVLWYKNIQEKINLCAKKSKSEPSVVSQI